MPSDDHDDILREIDRLGSDSRPARKTQIEDHFDAFTREWVELHDELPTPEAVRRFKEKWERDHFGEEAKTKALACKAAVRPDPATGEVYDPDDLAATAAKYGRDLSKDPSLAELRRMFARGRRLLEAERALRIEQSKDEFHRRLAGAKKRREVADSNLRAEAACSALPSASSGAVSGNSDITGCVRKKHGAWNRNILLEIQKNLDAGLPVRLTNRKVHVVKPPKPGSDQVLSTTTDPIVWVPHWEKAPAPLKAMAIGIACAGKAGFAFTCHLGETVLADVTSRGDGKLAQHIYRRFKDTLDRDLKKKSMSSPDFMFVVEEGKGERLHIHGVIMVPEIVGVRRSASRKPAAHGYLTASDLRNLRGVLWEAAGKDWKPRGHDMTQIDLTDLYEPAGWVSYITKYADLTRAKHGDNIFAASNALRRDGKAWYEDVRKRTGLLLPGNAVAIGSASPPST